MQFTYIIIIFWKNIKFVHNMGAFMTIQLSCLILQTQRQHPRSRGSWCADRWAAAIDPPNHQNLSHFLIPLQWPQGWISLESWLEKRASQQVRGGQNSRMLRKSSRLTQFHLLPGIVSCYLGFANSNITRYHKHCAPQSKTASFSLWNKLHSVPSTISMLENVNPRCTKIMQITHLRRRQQ